MNSIALPACGPYSATLARAKAWILGKKLLR